MKSFKMRLAAGMVLGGLSVFVIPAFAQNWVKTTLPDASWRLVFSSADGVKIFAVGEYPGLYTSMDSGVTWSSNNVYGYDWTSLASSADGTKLVAGASYGWIYTSTNSGATWKARSAPFASYWISVASSADGTRLVAAGNGGWIYTSTNSGATWRSNSVPGYYWVSVASSADGSKLVAAAYHAAAFDNGAIYTSTDAGLTWKSNNVPGYNWSSVASSADGTRLVAGANYGWIYTSTNSGATWRSNIVLRSSCSSVASSADGTRLVAGASYGWIYTSTNSGATWRSNNVPGYYQTSVATSADGTKSVAALEDGGVYVSLSAPNPPLIIIQPQDQSQPAGAEAIFTVTAAGPEPLSYQWQCQGTNLTGATNSILRLPNVQPDQSGTYHVVVSDAFGMVISSDVMFVVGPAQPFTVLHHFDNITRGPTTLILSDKFYGCSGMGSALFSINPDGDGLTVLHTNSASGLGLWELVWGGNVLYGVAVFPGPTFNYDIVYSIGTDGSGFKVLHDFSTNSAEGIYPETLACSGDMVFGTTRGTGYASGTTNGTLFSMKSDGSHFSVLHTFGAEGRSVGRLLLSGNVLYGTVASGNNGGGAVFAMNTNGSNFALIYNFTTNSTDGSGPSGNLICSGGRFYGTTTGGGVYGQGVLFSLGTNGTGYTVLHHFTSADDPEGTILLTLGQDTVYGLLEKGGRYGTNGLPKPATIFAVSTKGTGFMMLHTFSDADGAFNMVSASLLYANGALYGVAPGGGFFGCGTLFRLQLQTIRIAGISAQPSGSVTINGAGYPGCSYLTQAATNLVPPINWQTVATNVAGPTGAWQFTDTSAGGFPARFYRLTTP